MSESRIGVLDCNNFFVSCERLFRPDLLNKPVVVLSSNDGCVIARSKEIKDMGIPMGVPYFKIKDTLEKAGATTFSTHFALYRDISKRVFEVMREELDVVEEYSIDEAFFEVEDDYDAVATRLKVAVETKVGIPVSIGIASNKTLAKYASKQAKHNGGIYIMGNANWHAKTTSVRLAEIWGVGGNSELNFKQHGLVTVEQFITADAGRIARLFGLSGARLQRELQGKIIYKIGQKREPKKSIISSRSFSKTSEDIAILSDAVSYHLRHAVAELRTFKLKTSLVRVSILPSRHGDFVLRGGAREYALDVPTNDSIELLKIANSLLNSIYEVGVPYKKAGVVLSHFVPEEIGQPNLFSTEKMDTNSELMATIDKINSKKNGEVILLGSRLMNEKWRARSETNSPAYTTRWSDIAKVLAK